MNTNPGKDPAIDRYHRDEERQWERERVAPVGEPPTEEDLRRSLVQRLPKRMVEARATLEKVQPAIDAGDIARVQTLVGAALHDIRNIENGVLALCECVKPQKD
jgi:hypothetical protein